MDSKLVKFGRLLILDTDECLEWTGATTEWGYGRLMYGNRQHLTHVLALTIHTDERPSGMDAMHSCHNTACMNHRHLSWGTPSENMNAMVRAGRHAGQKMTHCRNGHERTPENTRYEYDSTGTMKRVRCKVCKVAYDAARRA